MHHMSCGAIGAQSFIPSSHTSCDTPFPPPRCTPPSLTVDGHPSCPHPPSSSLLQCPPFRILQCPPFPPVPNALPRVVNSGGLTRAHEAKRSDAAPSRAKRSFQRRVGRRRSAVAADRSGRKIVLGFHAKKRTKTSRKRARTDVEGVEGFPPLRSTRV